MPQMVDEKLLLYASSQRQRASPATPWKRVETNVHEGKKRKEVSEMQLGLACEGRNAGWISLLR